MANRKKEVYKPKPMTEGKRNLIQGLLQEYDIQSAEDIQDALKDLLSGTIQDMLETEMDDHLGYDRYERSGEPNYRNGTKSKTVRSKYGEFQVDVPQDRQSSFEPQVLPKRQKDISSIDDKIISMYAKGMTTRQISETIELTPSRKKKVAGVVCFLGKKCHYWQRCLLPALNSAIGKSLPFSLIITSQ